MRVLVTGSSGFVGQGLVATLEERGDTVVRAVRGRNDTIGGEQLHWDVRHGIHEPERRLDAVIHLAGANIAGRPWTTARKAVLWSSRVDATEALCKSLSSWKHPPGVFVSTSAIGYYGARGGDLLGPDAERGAGFLASLCEAWEAATTSLPDTVAVRIVRTGIVLGAGGGALAKMLPLFRAGLGGDLGDGQHYMSWIHRADLCALYTALLRRDDAARIHHGVAPHPVRNEIFTRALGHALGRGTPLPAPRFALRLALGRELADEAVLASQRVVATEPEARFRYPTIAQALEAVVREATPEFG